MAEMPAKTKTIQKGAIKTYGAPFSKFGAVIEGQTLSNPQLVITSGSQIIIGTPTINATEFVDDDGGDPIPANEGVISKLDFTNAVPGTYRMEWKASATPSGDKLIVSGKIIVTDPVV